MLHLNSLSSLIGRFPLDQKFLCEFPEISQCELNCELNCELVDCSKVKNVIRRKLEKVRFLLGGGGGGGGAIPRMDYCITLHKYLLRNI